jgi:YgiT-type zinc finger domain-containing protein
MDAGFYQEDQTMKCPICKHGDTKPGSATVTLERGESTIIFRQVPAEICENCGEAFHSAEVTEALLQQAEAAAAQGVEIDVRRFAVAA